MQGNHIMDGIHLHVQFHFRNIMGKIDAHGIILDFDILILLDVILREYSKNRDARAIHGLFVTEFVKYIKYIILEHEEKCDAP